MTAPIVHPTAPEACITREGAHWRVVFAGVDLGLAESYAEACEYVEAWAEQLAEDAAALASAQQQRRAA
jgi:hypothetical protein